MTHHESAYASQEEVEDRFYVQFDSREVELMTLDELQTAFEAGQIHENTYVCKEGESEWLTLAIVAGLGEEEEEEAPAPVSAVERRPPMPERRPAMPVASESRPPMPERRPEMNTMPAQRFQSQVPSVVISQPAPLSYAPVTSNIDLSSLDLDDETALRPKRRWGLLMAAAAVLVVGGGGAAFALSGGGAAIASAMPNEAQLKAAANNSQASLSLAHLEQPKAAEPVAPAPAPEPAAAAAPAAEATPAASDKAGFSDEMKQALLAADKSNAKKHGVKAAKGGKARAAAAAPRRGKGVASGFKSGGSAYDPLNGKL